MELNIQVTTNKLYLLHGIFCEIIVFHQFMENCLAYFCLLRRGRSSELVKFYVKPLVNLVMDSMVPAFSVKKGFSEESVFPLSSGICSKETMYIAYQELIVENFMCTIQDRVKKVGLRLGEMLVTRIL